MTTSERKNQLDLLQDPVPETLKKMTVPMIYGMILLMTFNLVDTFFVSMLGTQPLAAISFTFPITFTVISLTIGLGIGTTAVIGKAFGQGDNTLAKNLATSSLYLAAMVVGILSYIGYVFIDEIFLLLGASDNMLPLIHDYMDVWFLGSICLIGPMIGNAILRSVGDTKTPSIIMGSAGLINAVLDPILIFGFGPIPALGLEGAAIATFISWAFGTALVLNILIRKKNLIHTTLIPLSEFITSCKSILTIGLPAAGANMLTPLATTILTAIAATFGESAVAAFGVGSRIESIACLVVLALSMTLPAFISQNFGASHMHRVKEGYKTSIKFVLAWQVLIYILLIFMAPYISQVFTKEDDVAEIIELFIWVLPLGYGLQGIIILTNSSFNALHKPMVALMLSLIRLFIFYVPIAYLGCYLYGLQGFFIGAVIGNLLMAFVSYYLFSKQFKTDVFNIDKKEASV